MNERIKLLAEQAKMFATPMKFHLGGQDYAKVRDEKFAELIVKECAELAKNKAESIVNKAELYGDDAEEIDTAKSTAWQFLVLEAEIKRHFGVDE